ncbi:unnamed protein product [Coregonus sp. 'balchen']|nr:unnamed protein product [Coregonus sp. 'balchen']
MRRHQHRIHKRHLRLKDKEAPLLQEAKPPKLPPITSQHYSSNTNTIAVLKNVGDQEEQYMLNISGNISENLSFYIDGKIVSTSTVSRCEVVGLDAVIINPAQISQALKVHAATRTGKERPGQPLTKMRTATPPLLPQIKTELELEAVVKQLLKTQDGLKLTLALITDSQKLCSPLSLTVIPAGSGGGGGGGGLKGEGLLLTHHSKALHQLLKAQQQMWKFLMFSILSTNDKSEISTSPPVEDTVTTHVLPEGWSPMSGGSSCNQQPWDLSNAVKRSEDEALREAVLDLSVHRKNAADSEAKGSLVPQPLNKKRRPNTIMLEKVLMNEYANLEVAAEQRLKNTVEATAPAQIVINHEEQQQLMSLPHHETVDPTVLVSTIEQSVTLSTLSAVISECPTFLESISSPVSAILKEESNQKEVCADISICQSETVQTSEGTSQVEESSNETLSKQQETFTKDLMCNVCDKLFHLMKELGHHVMIYICCACTNEFAYLRNLKHHQEELHSGKECKYTEKENGKLRPQNDNSKTKFSTEASSTSDKAAIKDEGELDDAREELFTTIKIMGSEGGKTKGLNVRLGINQHYPSHNRTPAGSVESATNFTTQSIPAIRCTKCLKSFDNMPELHKYILACANANNKRRHTPKKNPIPLRHFAKVQNGVLSSTNSTNCQNALYMASQTNRPILNQEPPAKLTLNALNEWKKTAGTEGHFTEE